MEPFLLSSSLLAVMAQRLVRLCVWNVANLINRVMPSGSDSDSRMRTCSSIVPGAVSTAT